ncbi:unnamed protein product, partial [Didymodactylos carnosus]
CKQMMIAGTKLWEDVQFTDVPSTRFNLYQELQLCFKINVFLLPKLDTILHQTFCEEIKNFVQQILNDVSGVPLEIRLSCSIAWHLSNSNQKFNETIQLMRNDNSVYSSLPITSRLPLYFGLIKTTNFKDINDGSILVQLVHNILSFQTRDSSIMVAVAKILETYSDSLNACSTIIDEKSLETIVKELFCFAWDNFGHNIEIIRHCTANIYTNTLKAAMSIDALRQQTRDTQLALLKNTPWQRHGCCLCYQALLHYTSVTSLLEWNSNLPKSCLDSMVDRSIACDASHLYCSMCYLHKKELTDDNKTIWYEIWIRPIVQALDNSTQTHRFCIAEYVLPKILKYDQDCLIECKKLSQNARTLIVCTRIGRNLGLCNQLFSLMNDTKNENSDDKEQVISKQLLYEAITAQDEQIRLDSLFILCENPKTTEQIRPIEIDLIEYFLNMNIDNAQPAFRNQCLALLKKHFIRLKESWLSCARSIIRKLRQEDDEYHTITHTYQKHLKWLIEWCCDQLYLEGSYCQRHLALSMLTWILDLHGTVVKTECGNF